MHSRIFAGLITAGALTLTGCATPAGQADEPTATETAAQGAAAGSADYDEWGRPSGHPSYGMEPVTFSMTAAEVWQAFSKSERTDVCTADSEGQQFNRLVFDTYQDEGVSSVLHFGTAEITTVIDADCTTIREKAEKAEAERKAREKAAKAAKEKAAREKFLASFTEVTTRTLAKIIRDPDGHAGENIIIYGEVTQYDSATGLDMIRADVASYNTTSYGWFKGDNAMLEGSAKLFDDLIEGDVFKAKVTVDRSLSYDTQIGGSTTVPLFTVETITRIGSTN